MRESSVLLLHYYRDRNVFLIFFNNECAAFTNRWRRSKSLECNIDSAESNSRSSIFFIRGEKRVSRYGLQLEVFGSESGLSVSKQSEAGHVSNMVPSLQLGHEIVRYSQFRVRDRCNDVRS